VIGSSGGFGGMGGGMTGGGGGNRNDIYMDSASPEMPESENPGQTQPGDQSGHTESDCKGGNPVILANGNKVEEEIDFLFGFRSQHPLHLERTYSHYWKGVGLFGKHWLSNYDYKLSFGSTDVNACYPRPGGGTCGIGANTVIWSWRPDGRTVRYVKAADGIFYEERPVPVAKIVPQSNGEFWLYDGSGAVERYSSAGYVASVTDPYGIAWTYSYNGTYPTRVTHTSGRYVEFTWTSGQLTAVRDPAGNYFGYAYTANAFGAGLHRLSATSRPGTPATNIAYHYEASGLPGALTGKSYGGVRYSWFVYSPSGYAIETRHGGTIEKYTFSYNPLGNGVMEVVETNPLGKQGTYIFNNGRIASYTGSASTHCAATYSERTFDANGFENIVSDFNGNLTDFDYNAKGQLVRAVEAAGTPLARTTEWVWDSAFSRLLSKTVVGQYRIEYGYTNDNRVASMTEINLSGYGVANQSRTTTYAYTKHANGLLATVTVDGPISGNGDAVTSTFDATGNLISVANSLGHTTTYSNHNGMGLPGRITGINGGITDYLYDGRGRIVTERRWIAGVSADTTYAYGSNDLISSISRPDGSTTHYVHDAARRLIRIWRPANGTVVGDAVKEDQVYAYDAMSNIVRVDNRILKNQLQTQCVRWQIIEGYPECMQEQQVWVEVPEIVQTAFTDYDQAGRARARRGNNGQNERYSYDLNGNLKTVTDSLGRVTTFSHDALDRTIAIVDAMNGQTRIEHDAGDRVTKVTDPKNLITTFVFDGFGQLWAMNSPDSGTNAFQYDAAGLQTLLTRNDGSQLGYQYDALGRMTYSGNAQWARFFSYDWCQNGKGLVCGLSVNDTQQVWNWTHFGYTPDGQLSVRRDSINGSDEWTGYAYDNGGRLTGISYPSGVVVGYGYTQGKLTLMNMTTASGVSHTVVNGIQHQPFADIAKWTYGNQLQRSIQTDHDGRPTSIQTGGVQGLLYEYNANDEIVRIVNSMDSGLTQVYGHDALGRLTAATTGANTATFEYDIAGNRIARTDNGVGTSYGYASGTHRLQSASSPVLNRSFVTNATGNMESWHGADGALNSVAFDSYQRVISHLRNGITTRYRYNALDQRVHKVGAGGGVHGRFYYRGQNELLAERHSNSSTGAVEWISHLWLEGRPVGLVRGNTLYWVHPDHQNRPETVTNAAQQPVWRAANYAFHRSVLLDAIGSYNLGFPGQYWDAESALWHNGFRDYEPTLGRYIQSDPTGIQDGINPYLYAKSSPLHSTDPLGLQADSFSQRIAIYIGRGDLRSLTNLYESGVLNPAQSQIARAGIERLSLTADQLIARELKASVLREFPGQLRQKTIAEIFQGAQNGDKACRTARKLLTDSRFKK